MNIKTNKRKPKYRVFFEINHDTTNRSILIVNASSEKKARLLAEKMIKQDKGIRYFYIISIEAVNSMD